MYEYSTSQESNLKHDENAHEIKLAFLPTLFVPTSIKIVRTNACLEFIKDIHAYELFHIETFLGAAT